MEEWRRLRDFGLKLHQERQNVARDMQQLGERFRSASDNFAKANRYLQELEAARQSFQLELAACDGAQQRELELKLWTIEELAFVHGGKRWLFLNATLRIHRVLRMNEAFLDLLNDLAVQVQRTLQASLDLLRCFARGDQPDRCLWAEFQQAANRLAHPYKVYQELQQQ